MAKALPIRWVDDGDAFGCRSLPWKRLSKGPLPALMLEAGAVAGGRDGRSRPVDAAPSLCLTCFISSSLWSVQLECLVSPYLPSV
jgi:hypothetical protein